MVMPTAKQGGGQRAWVPPSLSPKSAAMRGWLARGLQGRTLALAGRAWHLAISWPLAPTPRLPTADDWCVQGNWNAAPFELHLPARAADLWLRARFPADDWPSLPPDWRGAVIEEALQELLDPWQGDVANGLQVDRVELGQGQQADGAPPTGMGAGCTPLHLRLTPLVERPCANGIDAPDSLAGLGAWLLLSKPALAELTRLTRHLPPAGRPSSALPLSLPLHVGASVMSHGELRSLQVGDAVVLQHCAIEGPQRLGLRWAGHRLQVQAHAGRWVVTESPRTEELLMNDDDDLLGPDDDLTDDEAPAAPELRNNDDLDVFDEFAFDEDDFEEGEVGVDSQLDDHGDEHGEGLDEEHGNGPDQDVDEDSAGNIEAARDDPLSREPLALPARTPSAAPLGDPVVLDALPVRVDFDLGRLRMTLAQLQALQVGEVLDLARPLTDFVTVRANGLRIGRGELVEVGGRLAVMLTSLEPDPSGRSS